MLQGPSGSALQGTEHRVIAHFPDFFRETAFGRSFCLLGTLIDGVFRRC
jgi:hypothetical protein